MLGFVSLFMDMSSELVHSLLPVFLVSALGASALTVGVIEGLAEAAALTAKVFSGAISDYFHRRKALLLLGYGMAALTKPLFPWRPRRKWCSWHGSLIASAKASGAHLATHWLRRRSSGDSRCLLRSSPVDGYRRGISRAIIGNIADVLVRQRHQAGFVVRRRARVRHGLFDSARSRGPGRLSARDRFRSPIRLDALKQFSGDYWRVVAIGAIFTLARFSEAFLVLRAQHAGFAIRWVPLVMIVMSLAYACSAYPAGILSDRVNRRYLLAAGIVLLIVADLVLARAGSPSVVLVGVALWGLHMGCTQGILAAMIAEVTPPELKGTAFGLFNLASGLFTLLASVIAGGLWETYGPAITFRVGAVFSLSALVMLVSLAPSGALAKRVGVR